MIEDIFVYKNYEVDEDRRTVRFNYEISHDGNFFSLQETVKFPITLTENQIMESTLDTLHLAIGISYYKIFLNESIQHPYTMSESQADFWNKIFSNGLGEFLYVNKLNKSRLAKFNVQTGKEISKSDNWNPTEKALLGISGGKDSIVAGELLKEINMPVEGFVIATGEQLGQTKHVSETMRVNLLAIERNIDKQLLEIQERDDAFKGHIPISLIFALIGSAVAIARGYKYVVVANESSASIPRVEWQGEMVNHQWSKSFEFETMLQNYLHENVSPKLTYFSAIRPIGSVSVVKLFAKLSQYYEIFTSDNSIFRINKDKRPEGRWSLESPKSLSSFILLSPWLSEANLIRTFGRNFLEEKSLEKLFYELIGLEGHQPLDCVGTEEELILSLNLMYRQGKFQDSFLTVKARERGAIRELDWQQQLRKHLELSDQHLIPDDIYQKFKPYITSSLISQLTDKNVVFVGAGRGRALDGVEDFIRSQVNIASFEAVDKDQSDQPLEFLNNYDMAKTVFIKNEGIPGKEMPVDYITPMQIFFDEVSKLGSRTIGITGTKGKSTTTALTAHILKASSSDVVLAGNIGISPLSALKDANRYTTFVLELSSYQLSDLRTSPNISACINLYNDHTTWHGSLEKYWQDKQNIVKYSTSNDIFIYNPTFKELGAWTEQTKAQSIAIDPNEPYDLSASKLFGDHNRLNVLVAREIAKQCGIDEETIRQAVDSFEPLEHRMQFVMEKDDIIYIDDAIGMTPESTTASIKAVIEKYGAIGCLLLGGQDREYEFQELMQFVSEQNIPNLVLFPDTIEKMRASLPTGYNPRIFETKNMNEAVNFAANNSNPGSVVLLSTAAPSYSLWQDFEQKGQEFKQAIKDLQ